MENFDMKKIIMLMCLFILCGLTACNCVGQPLASPSDVSQTNVISDTNEKDDGALTVEEILANKFNREILESVGITEIKEAVMLEANPGRGGNYDILITDAEDNVFYVLCNGYGAIDVIQKDNLEGETIFYILP